MAISKTIDPVVEPASLAFVIGHTRIPTMPTSTTQLWGQGPEPALLASRNRRTGAIVFPPVHPTSPLAKDFDPLSIGSRGGLYSYTVIHPNPKTGQTPYAMGYVDLDDQPVRLFGQLRGSSRPEIGARYRATPDDTFGYVFELIAKGEKHE
jgi:uncharacterized OB-fold protein